MPFAATRMDLELIIPSEVSQRKTNTRYHYMWNLKKIIQMNLLTKQKQTHNHRKQAHGTKGKGGRGSDKIEV